MKKKILFVMINLYNGGAEKSLINLFNEIDYTKYDIDLLLFQRSGLFLKQVPSTVNIINCPDDLYYLYNKPIIKDLFNLKKMKIIFYRYFYNFILKIRYRNYKPAVVKQLRWKKYYKNILSNLENNYDVAISYLNNDSMYYVIDKVICSKKYLWIHNNYKKSGFLKSLDKEYYSKADRIVTVSKICLDVFNDVFSEYKYKSICIPNISSKKTIVSLSEKEPEYNFKNDVFKIISIGRLSYEKGLDLALETAKILRKKGVKYQWLVIGDGSLRVQLENNIKKYDLKDYFYLIGTTDNPYSYIKRADILVQPSRTEGKSMVLDEAKILGKSFVVTKYPTVYDQVSDDIAVIVDIDSESIANGIMELYNNRSKLRLLESNLKRYDFSNEHEIKKYYDLFDE